MVSFVCDACNETVKKAKVDAHASKCRNCWYMSCIDCGVTFEGEAYAVHTECMSEAQKYQGALYKGPKHVPVLPKDLKGVEAPNEEALSHVKSGKGDSTSKKRQRDDAGGSSKGSSQDKDDEKKKKKKKTKTKKGKEDKEDKKKEKMPSKLKKAIPYLLQQQGDRTLKVKKLNKQCRSHFLSSDSGENAGKKWDKKFDKALAKAKGVTVNDGKAVLS